MKKLAGGLFIVVLFLVGGISAVIGYDRGVDDVQIRLNPFTLSSESITFSKNTAPSDPNRSYITINNERWWVINTDSTAFYGQTDCNQRVIWFNPKQGTRQAARNTMWHEIFHAAGMCRIDLPDEDSNWVNGLQSDKQDNPEHRAIENKADFLTNFVHDNPEFMKWAENWGDQ